MDKISDPFTELLAIGYGAFIFAFGVYIIIYGLEGIARRINKRNEK